jgi:hypothetical protein
MPEPRPEPNRNHRPGLVENAAGGLRCPLRDCGKPLVDVLFVAVHTEYGHHMILPLMHTMDSRIQTEVNGIPGIVVGLQCQRQHRTSVSLVAMEGNVTVKTEWDTDTDTEEDERDA